MTLPGQWTRGRLGVASAGLLIAYAVLATAFAGTRPGPGGAPGSSYGTAGAGLAAYAELLGRSGHPVRQIRGRLRARIQAAPGSTLFLIDPDTLTRADVSALRAFAQAGNTVIAGGTGPADWTDALTADASLRPVAGLGSEADMIATGSGRIVILDRPQSLENGALADGADASAAAALAGPPGTPALFAEGVHGYGTTTGLAALPGRWKLALAGLALAAALGAAARFRRLGAPDPESEATSTLPPRRAHVEAIAAALARTGPASEAIDPTRTRIQTLVRRQASLDPSADRFQVVTAAVGLGLGEPVARLAVGLDPTRDEPALLALGRALARLERTERAGATARRPAAAEARA